MRQEPRWPAGRLRHLVYCRRAAPPAAGPPPSPTEVVRLLCDDDTVTNVAVRRRAATPSPPGTLVIADVAREGANPVVAALRALDLHHVGSIMISEPGDAPVRRRRARPRRRRPAIPDDGIVWDVVENRVRTESVLSWAFLSVPDAGHADRRAPAGCSTSPS